MATTVQVEGCGRKQLQIFTPFRFYIGVKMQARGP